MNGKSQQQTILNNLKRSLKSTLNHGTIKNESNDNNNSISKIHFKLNSIIDILPFVINQHILSYLHIEETSKYARICKDFYKINTNLIKRNCFESPLVSVQLIESYSLVRFQMVDSYRQIVIDYATFKNCLKYHQFIMFDSFICISYEDHWYPKKKRFVVN